MPPPRRLSMAPQVEALAASVAATWTAPDAPRFVRLGRYQLDRELGRGTFGVVFAGFDCELQREVAVKVFEASTPSLREAVEREARLLAAVRHANVVAHHDLGREGELLYLVMEYVDGWTLGERVRMGLDWRGVTRLFVQAARGLAAAHRTGIQHGDVKPANILVDHDGRVQLADFGLARMLHADGPTDGPSRGGTRCYAAPEWLFEGTSDARSDQFSLCVALWEVLYGGRPWARDGVEYEAMLVEAVEPRKRRKLAGVPAELEAVVRRGLAARSRDRFASTDDLADALARVVLGVDRPQPRRWLRAGLAGAALILAGLSTKILALL